MSCSVKFRKGDKESLTKEFLDKTKFGGDIFTVEKLKEPQLLREENILAVHFANAGAQGDAGAVEILYNYCNKIKVIYGNYAYEELDLDALCEKVPALDRLLRGDYIIPYPYAGELNIPDDWGYMYMGCMNHFLGRKEIMLQSAEFIKYMLKNGGYTFQVFDAVAWFFFAEEI